MNEQEPTPEKSIYDRINGAVCITCDRWYSLEELEALDEDAELAPCGHSMTGLFDTLEE